MLTQCGTYRLMLLLPRQIVRLAIADTVASSDKDLSQNNVYILRCRVMLLVWRQR